VQRVSGDAEPGELKIVEQLLTVTSNSDNDLSVDSKMIRLTSDQDISVKISQ
jgi:hypothetical protein